MGKSIGKRIALSFASLFGLFATLIATPAAAKDCTLKQLASLDITRSGDALAIPVKIAGTERTMLVNLAVPDTVVTRSVADELKLALVPLGSAVKAGIAGDRIEGWVVLPEIQIGLSLGRNVGVLLIAGSQLKPGIAGVLGTGALSNFDTDFDFRNAKLNLFAKDHCKGDVVYWADAFTSLHYRLGYLKQTYFDASLDGVAVRVSLTTYGAHTFMDFPAATRLFGITEGSPGVTVLSRDAAGTPTLYRYAFKQLSLGGTAVNNPAIDIYPAPDTPCKGGAPRVIRNGHVFECRGPVDLYLGLNVLQQLHLYFAADERTLYVTAADAHK